MIKFSIFGIPTTVHWFFWILSLFVGGGMYAQGRDATIALLVHVAVIFVSIMVHELGHALVGRKFGAYPSIGLHGMGGVTHLPGSGFFTRRQHIMVIAAGPLAGLALGLLCLVARDAMRDGAFAPPLLLRFVAFGVFVNFAWTFFNVLPIQPMDGGQILREVLGPKRFRLTCIIGGVTACVVPSFAFTSGWIFMTILLGYFAFLNFQGQAREGGVMSR